MFYFLLKFAFFWASISHVTLGEDIVYDVTEIVTDTVNPEEEFPGSTISSTVSDHTCEYNGSCGETTMVVTPGSTSAESSSVSDSSTFVSHTVSESSSSNGSPSHQPVTLSIASTEATSKNSFSTEATSEGSVPTAASSVNTKFDSSLGTHSTPLTAGESSTTPLGLSNSSTVSGQTIVSFTGHSFESKSTRSGHWSHFTNKGPTETPSFGHSHKSHSTSSGQANGHSSAAANGQSGAANGQSAAANGKTAAAVGRAIATTTIKTTTTTKAAANNVFWPGFLNVGTPAAQEPPAPSPDTLPQEQDFDNSNEDTPDNEALAPSDTLGSQKVEKCGNETHPWVVMKRVLIKKKIFNIYQVSKCNVDYHDSCGSQWKDCKGYGAQAFCPKFCHFNNCSAAISQHGKLEPYKPKYVPENKCKDNPNFPCRASVARGDCYATPELMAVNCSMSCGLCENMKPYAPLSFEEQRMQRWLKSYNNSQYEKYSKVFNRRRIVLHYKIYKKLCADRLHSRQTFAPLSTEQMRTTVIPTQGTQAPGAGQNEVSTMTHVSGVASSTTFGFSQEKSSILTSTPQTMQISTANYAENFLVDNKDAVLKAENVLLEEDFISEDTVNEEHDYDQADQETIENEASGSSYSFDAQPINKCANNTHPTVVIIRIMKQINIYQTYEQSKCQVDYHDSCSTQWADCKGYGATAFCPKFCSVKDCQAALALHEKLTRYQPKYVPEAKCADSPKFNCSKLSGRGDCYASPQQFGQLCAKSCGLCLNMKKYTPFSFEDQRLARWLSDFNSGQYKKYAKVLIRRRKIIKRKIIGGKC